MADDAAAKTITMTITNDTVTGQSNITLQSSPTITNDDLWLGLKMIVTQMGISSAYIPDPTAREQIGTCAKAMKNMVLGTEAAIAQVKEKEAMMKKELG